VACHQAGVSYTDTMWPIETIQAFDLFLLDRGLRFDGVVIGGAALSLLGIVSRPAKDVDILVPKPSGDSRRRAPSQRKFA